MNREELWCRVQPGLVQDELNAYVRPMGLQFGPDTSTSNRATIGGMIGNNSAGAHSLTYGKTLDHVLELTVLLSDGSEVVLKDLSPESLEDKRRADTLESRSTGRSRDLRASTRMKSWHAIPGLCVESPVTTWTSSSQGSPLIYRGFSSALKEHWAPLSRPRCVWCRSPSGQLWMSFTFTARSRSIECSQVVLQTAPYAMESTDKMILNLARGNIEQSRKLGFVQGVQTLC